MAMNPMQRKANNYLLIGIFGTLLVTGLIIVFLFLQLNNLQQEAKKQKGAQKEIYVLNQDVKSGQILTEDMYEIKKVNIETIPSGATATGEVISSWYLLTKEGDSIYTDVTEEIDLLVSNQKTKLYLKKSDSVIEVYQDKNNYYMIAGVDENQELIRVYVEKELVQEDDDGYYIMSNDTYIDDKARIYQTKSENYYVYIYDKTQNSRKRSYIEIDNVPLTAKIDMNKNTVITPNMIVKADEEIGEDLREQEYNMVILPSQIQSGDYIDIRLMLSNGVDYIVASKKKVEIPTIDGVDSANSIIINMNETETMVMSNAIIEAYIDKGSLLYATTYVEPGLQETSTPTYVPSGDVQNALNANSNIAQEAKIALIARYNQNVDTRTKLINATLAQYEQDRVDNIEEGVQEQILKAQEQRQLYLESLGGY